MVGDGSCNHVSYHVFIGNSEDEDVEDDSNLSGSDPHVK